ncbi:unnamed protein product [Spirodela intermedia]|uniref:Replication protein A subunit n=1 Tax=Spirodela intermedia TaxID=51605 RepID=A0A7I8INA0_SPIIN|nr:unnamed protein product [Spirodela intermedia]CAA6659335.1 unnamed protein product [Spirodela intermedia]
MAVNLTRNAIAAVMGGDLNLKPLVQVLDIKSVISAQERFRLVVSDGGCTQQALLAAQLNGRVKSGAVQKGSVVQLIEYVCSSVQNTQVIVVLNLETIVSNCEIIGNPRYESDPHAQNSPSSSANSAFTRGIRVRGAFCVWFSPETATLSAANPGINSHTFHPTLQSSGAILKNEAPARIVPISALNPYQGRWAIKARVTGDGKVFSFDLLDSDGGEIRVTCFNAAADRFFDRIEAGKVYLISRGSIKPAQKNFNHLDHQWEILLDSSSTVDPCPDEDSSIPEQQFNFREIDEIESAENNSVLDLIGIVTSIGPSTTILRKNGMETQRRILSLKDSSGKSVDLTLWGISMCHSGSFPVLAVKAGKVNDFSGKTVGTISSTRFFINPNLTEAQSLRDWFNGGGKAATSQSISRDAMPVHLEGEIRKTVAQIKDEGLGRGDKPDWVTLKATVSFIKTDTFCYTACPLMAGERQCGKKYLLQVQVQDHTGSTWVTCFQESGVEILGFSAKQMYLMKHVEEDEDRFAEIIRRCLFEQYLFRLKVKEEVHGTSRNSGSQWSRQRKSTRPSSVDLYWTGLPRLL